VYLQKPHLVIAGLTHNLVFGTYEISNQVRYDGFLEVLTSMSHRFLNKNIYFQLNTRKYTYHT